MLTISILDSIVKGKDRVSTEVWSRVKDDMELSISLGGLGFGSPRESLLTSYLANFVNVKEQLYSKNKFAILCDTLILLSDD